MVPNLFFGFSRNFVSMVQKMTAVQASRSQHNEHRDKQQPPDAELPNPIKTLWLKECFLTYKQQWRLERKKNGLGARSKTCFAKSCWVILRVDLYLSIFIANTISSAADTPVHASWRKLRRTRSERDTHRLTQGSSTYTSTKQTYTRWNRMELMSNSPMAPTSSSKVVCSRHSNFAINRLTCNPS